jgi:hypothetical protein
MLSLGIRHGLTTELERSRLICSLQNSRQAEAQEAALRAAEARAEAPEAALRAAGALASRRGEALTAAMTLRLEELVDVMAQTVEVASELEKAIWR